MSMKHYFITKILMVLFLLSLVIANCFSVIDIKYNSILILIIIVLLLFGDRIKEISLGNLKIIKDSIESNTKAIDYLKTLILQNNNKNITNNYNGNVSLNPATEEQINTKKDEEKQYEEIESRTTKEVHSFRNIDWEQTQAHILNNLYKDKEINLNPSNESYDKNISINNPICSSPSIFKYRTKQYSEELFYEILKDSTVLFRKELLYKELIDLQNYSTQNNISVCLILILIKLPTEKNKICIEDYLKSYFKPAINKGLLKIVSYTLNEKEFIHKKK